MELPCDDKILVKYENYMSKDDYDKYWWVIYCINSLSSPIGVSVIADCSNISRDDFNNLSIDKQLPIVIDAIKRVFIYVMTKVITIHGIAMNILLKDEGIPRFVLLAMSVETIFACLEKAITDEKIDISEYVTSVVNSEIRKNLDNLQLKTPRDFNHMMCLMHMTNLFSYTKADDIKNNVDDIITALSNIMKTKHREIIGNHYN